MSTESSDDNKKRPATKRKRVAKAPAAKKPATKNPDTDKAAAVEEPLYVVGIGASAGGLEATRPMLANLSKNGKAAYIIAQHMSPQHRSMLVELLNKESKLPVLEASNGLLLKADTIYVTPPNKDSFIKGGKVFLRRPTEAIGPKPSVDTLFASMANELGDHAIGVILSGTGSDGSHGCRTIKAAGGITIAQEPGSAKYDGMPGSAIRADAIDLVLEPEAIGKQLSAIIESPPPDIPVATRDDDEDMDAPTLKSLLNQVFRRTNIDFSNYKESTIGRQLQRRMTSLRIETLDDYFEYIQSHPIELENIQKSFLISVTSFFRDTKAFDAITGVLQSIIQTKKPRDTIRIWVPACATGEEVYTFAIILAELLGNRLHEFNVKIFGTDIDLGATEVARKGLYPEPSLAGLEQQIIDRYFLQEGRLYRVNKLIREMCVFARQDIVRDPPFLRMDMISCRNLLIYMKNNLQDKLINSFHYSLLPGGYMFLGQSESIGNAGMALFNTYDSTNKIFLRRAVQTPRPILLGDGMQALPVVPAAPIKPVKSDAKVQSDAVREKLLDHYAPPSILINANLEPLHFYGDAKRFVEVPDGDASWVLTSLIIKPLQTELRSLLHRSKDAEDGAVGNLIKVELGGEPKLVQLILRKVWLDEVAEQAYLISFEVRQPTTSTAVSVADTGEHNDSNVTEQIQELEHELAGTREHLQAVIEELETSNEELQSLNEELQASTEELQSSNEELETTNEELQATNEELTTVNDEMQEKSNELSEINADLLNIQNSISMGVIVLDNNLHITRYTPQAVRVFGIMPEDIGQSLLGLPSYVKIDDFRRKLLTVIQSGEAYTEDLQREDTQFLMQISPYRDHRGQHTGAVLTVSDITETYRARKLRTETEERFRLITESLQEVVWMSSANQEKMLYVSPSYEQLWGRSTDSLYDNPSTYIEGIHPEDRKRFQSELKNTDSAWNIEFRVVTPTGEIKWVKDRGVKIWNDDGELEYLIGSAINISDRVRAERENEVNYLRFSQTFNSAAIGMCLAKRDGTITDINQAFAQWLGYNTTDLIGKHFSDITHPDDRDANTNHFEKLVEGELDSYVIDKRYLKKTGGVLWGRLTSNLCEPNDPEIDSFVVAMIEDINEDKERQSTMYEQANFDKLTELPNRNLFMDRISEQTKITNRSGNALYVMFIDLDGFKAINDNNGHDIGDDVLREVANRMRQQIRESDTVARFGGDEFIVLLSEVLHIEAVERIASEFLEALCQPYKIGKQTFSMSASIGIACYPKDAKSTEELIQQADTAMYKAKAEGGNCFRYYSSKMNDQAVERDHLRNDIATALVEDQFQLVFQPIFDHSAGCFTHAEALVRWQHPTRGTIQPSVFIEHAENAGQSRAINSWVFREAAQYVQRWHKRWGDDFVLAFNLTSSMMDRHEFELLLTEWKHILGNLCLEVTESALTDRSSNVLRRLAMAKSMGAKIGLDDFGTGHSSLIQLQKAPVDYIKLDRNFIRGISASGEGGDIAHSVALIANSIGARIIAEGVETEIQSEFIGRLKGALSQGYFYSKPLNSKDFEALMDKQKNKKAAKA